MQYEDMLTHPRHVSLRHHPMSRENRAAQFAPFAALTGYDEAVAETARLTDSLDDLSEDARDALDATMQYLLTHEQEHPCVRILYFEPDRHKAGGAYREYTGCLRFLDVPGGMMHFTDRSSLPLAAIQAAQIVEET